MYNNHTATDNTYYKAHLIKVVEVAVLDAVLYTHIGYQPEPCIYLVRVFAEGPLEVIGTQQTRFELRTALYKSVCLLLADRLHATHCKEQGRYIFYTINPGQESSHI